MGWHIFSPAPGRRLLNNEKSLSLKGASGVGPAIPLRVSVTESRHRPPPMIDLKLTKSINF